MGRRRDRRSGRRDGRDALDGGACRRQDHRGRWLARDHGLAASGRDRRDPGSGGRRRCRGTRLGGQMSVESLDQRSVQRVARGSFGRLRQIDAGLLDVGYVDAGPADGPAVVLLHGWPYDIHSYDDVLPLLAAAGHRVIVPYLRGYGSTRFLSDETLRNGEQAALAVDVVALMDALEIETAIVAGFDWGARTADIVAALWPERCNGARVGERISDRQPGGRRGAAAAGGRAAVVVPVLLRHRARSRRLRQVPARVREAHLANRVAEVGLRRRHVRAQRGVLRQPGSRRHRDPQLSLAPGAGRRRGRIRRAGAAARRRPGHHRARRSRSRATRTARHIRSRTSTPSKFSGRYSHRTIEGGIGHNLPQEAPEAFADAVLELGGIRE